MEYKSIREYLKSVCCETTLLEIVDDYEKFIEDGFVGECRLRRVEKLCVKALTGYDNLVRPTEWFDNIALESYRLLYEIEKKKRENLCERFASVVNSF